MYSNGLVVSVQNLLQPRNWLPSATARNKWGFHFSLRLHSTI